MKLSIVMMVKNEEKYLDKTLSSLKPIREKIKSELIILDTGSTDKTVEIAKKYTSKVYFKEWNDNFADMRNKSISYAKGEWLLILDGDEPVVEYNRLLDFFRSSKSKKYNSATIELINFQNLNPIKKSIGRVPRFFRNIKEFKYSGIIHEQPVIIEPMYDSIITCEHYGYLYIDKKLQNKKTSRNIKLLEKQLLEEPNNAYILAHLAISYLQINKLKDSLIYAKKSYDIIKLRDDKGLGLKYAHHYVSYIVTLISNSRFKYAYDICMEYMDFDKKNIDVLFYLGYTCLSLGKFKECISYLKDYIYYIENYNKSSQYESEYVKTDCIDKKDDACKYIVISYYNLEDYSNILRFINNNQFDYSLVFLHIITALYNNDKLDKIISFYKDLKDRDKHKFINIIENNLNTIFKKDDLHYLYKSFSDTEDEYGIFNKYRINKKYNKKLTDILISKNGLYYYQIIDIYINENKSIPDFFKYLFDEKLETALTYCIKNNFTFKFLLEEIILKVNNTLDINLIRIYKIITKALLFNGQLFEESYNQIFDLYLMYNKIYDILTNKNQKNDSLICNITTFEQMFIKELDNLKNIKDNVLYIRKLKNLAIDYPNHKKSVDYLKELFEKSLNETEEVKLLKKQFIDMISNNISKDNTQQIEVLLEQYKELYGIDKEILNIYGILDIYKENLDLAEINFKNALALDVYNPDTLYNIAYLKELKGEFKEAKLFYEFCKDNTDEQDLINICNEKINSIKIGE